MFLLKTAETPGLLPRCFFFRYAWLRTIAEVQPLHGNPGRLRRASDVSKIATTAGGGVLPLAIGVCAVIEEKIRSTSDIRGTGSVDCLDEPGRRVAGSGRALRGGIKCSSGDRDIKGPLELARDAISNRVPIGGSCFACSWA